MEHCIIDIGRFRAVLFDMDGVVTDTMPIHLKAWQEAFRPYGVEVSCMDVYLREGMTSRAMAGAIATEKDKGLSAEALDKITEDKGRIFDREAGALARTFDCVPETLHMLRNNGIKTALITGSSARAVSKVLKLTRIEQLFDVIVTGDDTSKGKPDPEPYLLGMARLEVSRINCVVVENAPLGLQSARAAGAEYVIAVTTSLDRSFLADADDIMDSMSELAQCFARRFAAIPGPGSF